MRFGNERGIAIVVALLVLVLISLLGTLFLTASMTESTISANEVNDSKAFWIAEAGMHHARKSLESFNPLVVSPFLDGTEEIFYSGSKGKGKGKGYDTQALAQGSYTVTVSNNTAANGFPRGSIPADDPPASDTVDGDGIVVLTSTGTVQGVQESVEIIMQTALPFPRIPGAIVAVSNGWNDVDVKSGAAVSGSGTDPLLDESGACPAQAGFAWRGISANPDCPGGVCGIIEGGGTWDGDPPEREYDSAIDDPMWDDPDQLVAMVNGWMSDPAAVNITGSSLPSTLGTAASPQITVWDPGSGSGGGNFTGYGILIVNPNSSFELTGPFEFHGLIISMQLHPGGSEAFEISDGTVHGSLLALNDHSSPGGEATEVGILSGAEVNYNCDALATYAGQASGGGSGGGNVTVLSWRPL